MMLFEFFYDKDGIRDLEIERKYSIFYVVNLGLC